MRERTMVSNSCHDCAHANWPRKQNGHRTPIGTCQISVPELPKALTTQHGFERMLRDERQIILARPYTQCPTWQELR